MSTMFIGIGEKFNAAQLRRVVLSAETDSEVSVYEATEEQMKQGFEYALVVDGNYLWFWTDDEYMSYAKYGRNDNEPCIDFLQLNFDTRIVSEHEDEFWDHVETGEE